MSIGCICVQCVCACACTHACAREHNRQCLQHSCKGNTPWIAVVLQHWPALPPLPCQTDLCCWNRQEPRLTRNSMPLKQLYLRCSISCLPITTDLGSVFLKPCPNLIYNVPNSTKGTVVGSYCTEMVIASYCLSCYVRSESLILSLSIQERQAFHPVRTAGLFVVDGSK